MFPLEIQWYDLDEAEAFNLQILAESLDVHVPADYQDRSKFPLWREESGVATTLAPLPGKTADHVFDLTNGEYVR